MFSLERNTTISIRFIISSQYLHKCCLFTYQFKLTHADFNIHFKTLIFHYFFHSWGEKNKTYKKQTEYGYTYLLHIVYNI